MFSICIPATTCSLQAPLSVNGLQIGVSSVWYEGNPCNMHLMDLAAEVKAGVQDAGMVAYRFNTIGVSDGISMGTDGMSFSLQSRDLIADSIETVMGGQWYDGNISLPGCDKNMPGVMIAMGRLNRPSVMVYGGTIKPGYSKDNEPLDIVSAFQSYGQSLWSCLCLFICLCDACVAAGLSVTVLLFGAVDSGFSDPHLHACDDTWLGVVLTQARHLTCCLVAVQSCL